MPKRGPRNRLLRLANTLRPSGKGLLRPAIAEAVLAFDAGEIAVEFFEFFTDVAHMGIDRIVRDQALHGRVHRVS